MQVDVPRGGEGVRVAAGVVADKWGGVCVYEEVVLPLQPQQRRWQYSSLAQSVRASDC